MRLEPNPVIGVLLVDDCIGKNNDGIVCVEEIQEALAEIGLSVDNRELSLAKFVHDFADTTGTGEVTIEDLEVFCEEMGDVSERDLWRFYFKKQNAPTSPAKTLS